MLPPHQIKDSGTLNQVTCSKTPWIRQETVHPFQSCPLNPNRRPTLFASEKVDRRTYAQSDSSSLRTIHDVAGQDFLLWHSHCQKGQWSLCVDNEVNARLDLMLRGYEPH